MKRTEIDELGRDSSRSEPDKLTKTCSLNFLEFRKVFAGFVLHKLVLCTKERRKTQGGEHVISNVTHRKP